MTEYYYVKFKKIWCDTYLATEIWQLLNMEYELLIMQHLK